MAPLHLGKLGECTGYICVFDLFTCRSLELERLLLSGLVIQRETDKSRFVPEFERVKSEWARSEGFPSSVPRTATTSIVRGGVHTSPYIITPVVRHVFIPFRKGIFRENASLKILRAIFKTAHLKYLPSIADELFNETRNTSQKGLERELNRVLNNRKSRSSLIPADYALFNFDDASSKFASGEERRATVRMEVVPRPESGDFKRDEGYVHLVIYVPVENLVKKWQNRPGDARFEVDSQQVANQLDVIRFNLQEISRNVSGKENPLDSSRHLIEDVCHPLKKTDLDESFFH